MLFATRRGLIPRQRLGRVHIGPARARIGVRERLAGRVLHDVSPRCPLSGPEAAFGHRGSFERSLATSAFVASCAAVASLNFLISAGLVLPLPIGSAALFIAYAERSAAMAL